VEVAGAILTVRSVERRERKYLQVSKITIDEQFDAMIEYVNAAHELAQAVADVDVFDPHIEIAQRRLDKATRNVKRLRVQRKYEKE